MSDPQPRRLKQKPRRAEPLQPDRPGADDQQVADDAAAQKNTTNVDATARKQRKTQAETALDNVRQGYD